MGRRAAGILIVVLAAAAFVVAPSSPAGAWTPPDGLPDGFPAPPPNIQDNPYISVSPKTAKKGDIVTLRVTGGDVNQLKSYGGYYTQASLSLAVAGSCPSPSQQCNFRVGAPNGWQGWLAIGAYLPGVGELGPYDALAILPSGAIALPGAPTNVTGTAGDAKVTVKWTKPSQGGGPITGYVITAYVGGIAVGAIGAPGTATSAVYTAENGKPYTFRVHAQNGGGDGPDSAMSTPVIPPFGSVNSYVTRQAQDFLGRAPTAAELTAEANKVKAGNNPGIVATDFRRSADGTKNVDPTTRLYFAYFQRIPDSGGLLFWVGEKRKGKALSAISSTFAASGEFKAKYGTLTNRAFVTLIYTDVLGRPADQAGVDFWTGQLDAKKKSRGQVMTGFSESNEYKTGHAKQVDVAVTWISMLRAAPDTASYNSWVTQFGAGKTVTDLAFALLKDSRYSDRF